MQNKPDFLRILGFFSIPFAVFIFNYVLFFLGTYRVLEWIDIPMHFLGGGAVAFAFFLALDHLQERGTITLNNAAKIIFVISLVCLTAVLWEFYEFSLEYLTGFDFQGTLNDTMSDLLFGLMGGTLTGIYMAFSDKK